MSEIASLFATINVETGKFRSGMAGVDAQLRGTAAKMREVDHASAASSRSLSNVGRSGALARAGSFAAKAGLAGVAFAAYEGYKQLRDQAKVSALTAAALKSTGQAAGVTKAHIESMSAALQAQTGLEDDAIQNAQNLLLTFTNIKNSGTDKMFDQATLAAMNLSVALGTDLRSSAIMVGKALNDPAKGVTALQRVGVSFSKAQKETIKSLVETGHTVEAQRMILRELEKETGGAAKAYGQSLPGQIARAQRSWEDFSQTLAATVLPPLLELLPTISDALKKLAPALLTLASAFTAVAVPLVNMTASIIANKTAMIGLVTVAGAFIALNFAGKVAAAANSFRTMAEMTGGQKLVGGITAMIGTAGRIGGAFAGAATGAGRFAREVTVFDRHVATAGRFSGAISAAKAEMSALGAVASSAMGGPWVMGITAAVVATTALGVAIGPALVESFAGAGSAAEQYSAALQNLSATTQTLQSTSGQMMSGMLSFTQATQAEAAARRAAAAAGGNDAAANARLAAAIARTDQVRGAAHAGLSAYIQGLRGSSQAVMETRSKLEGAIAPMGLVDRKTEEGAAAWRRHEAAVRLANQAVGNTTAYKNQQAELGRLSDYLKGLGPKYASVAAEAGKVAKMKPGEAQAAAVQKLIGHLDKVDQRVKGSSPTVKLKADSSQADKTIDALKQKLATLTDKSITVTTNQVTVGGTGNTSGSKARGMEDRPLYDRIASRQQTAPGNLQNIVGQPESNPGILDLIAQMRKLKNAVYPLGISEEIAASAAQKLSQDIATSAKWHALTSAYTKAHTASIKAKTDTEKESARKALATARHNLILSLSHTAAGREALKHKSYNELLAMSHKKAKKATDDLTTSTMLAASIQTDLAKAIDDANTAVDTAVPPIDNLTNGVDNLGAASEAAQKKLSQTQTIVGRVFTQLRDALTPTEQLIKDIQGQGQQADLTNALDDAQAALNTALQFGDPAQIRDAQRSLAAAQRNATIAQLQPVADAERQVRNDFFDYLDPAAIAQHIIDDFGGAVNGQTIQAAINLTISDNTLAGMSRDQVDALARQIGPAISRQITMAY